MTSLLTSPQQGHNAAETGRGDGAVRVAPPVTEETTRLGVQDHWMPGMTRHTHGTRDERLACEAEHAAIRGRWDALTTE